MLRLWGQVVSISTEPRFPGLPPLTAASKILLDGALETCLAFPSSIFPSRARPLPPHWPRWTMRLVPNSLLVHFPLPGALSPSRSLHLLHPLSLSSHAIFPENLVIIQSSFQFKPTHPRSQRRHHVPASFSLWRVLLFEAILLVYLLTCLLLLSSPPQGEALSLLLGAGPKAQKRTCTELLMDEMAHLLPTPGPQPRWPHSQTPSSSVQMQRNLKPWKKLPNSHSPPPGNV